MARFASLKSIALEGQDLSRKGSVDEAIRPLVQFINSKPQYFTTSSCSGRTLVLADGVVAQQQKSSIVKDGCQWIHVTHDKCNAEEFIERVHLAKCDDMTFKFEAFVLHVQCRSLDDAQAMLSSGVQAGFRNSGISLKSRKNPQQEWPKIMVAIRSTHGLEAPISSGGKMIVTNEYIHHLVTKANTLMDENLKRIDRFFENLRKSVSEPE